MGTGLEIAAWAALAAGTAATVSQYNKAEKQEDKLKAIAEENKRKLEDEKKYKAGLRRNLFETQGGVLGQEVNQTTSLGRGRILGN